MRNDHFLFLKGGNMKKILLSCITMLLMAGCSPSYPRDTSTARLRQLSMDEVNGMIENDETFMFVFTQETCSSCLYFKEKVLFYYIQDHGFDFNEVVLDMESDDFQKAADFVAEHPNPEQFLTSDLLPTDVLTPSFYFIEEGEVMEIYIGGDLSVDEFDQLIQKYQLDKIEE